ncbi:hypothetical protein BB558_002271, partial [Smittium angustum]
MRQIYKKRNSNYKDDEKYFCLANSRVGINREYSAYERGLVMDKENYSKKTTVWVAISEA